MAAQLRPSRVERRQIDEREIRMNNDRRGIAEVYRDARGTTNHVDLSHRDIISFVRKFKNIVKTDEAHVQSIPHFPYIPVYLAIVKDLLDFADITGVGIIVTTILSIIASCALIVWAWGKTSFRAWKEKILRWLIISIIIELIPAVKFIPSTVILVLLIHYREIKAIRLANLLIEYLKKGGVLDDIV
ncbi:hypothetical protein H7X65_00080 [Candidatus Parcubacteria bacterium]|nr:hypothetical protein [Candidatus Parcubacteria bacterium]